MSYNLSGHTELISEIKRQIDKKSRITFAEFMDIALYWPGKGYYTSENVRWGKDGDYLTSIDVSPVFGRLLAHQINEMWQNLGSPPQFSIIEVGAGREELSFHIRDTIKKLFPEFYKTADFQLVDVNPIHIQKLEERTSFHSSIEDIKPGITGCIISNELIDAFPVHRVVEMDGRLKEIYVGYDDAGFMDIRGELSSDGLNDYLEKIGITLFIRSGIRTSQQRWISRALRQQAGMPALRLQVLQHSSISLWASVRLGNLKRLKN